MQRIAFQGVRGCFSYLAARKHFPALEPVGVADFAGVTAAVRSGKAACGIIPLDNTLAGKVSSAHEALAAEPELGIVSEIRFPVHLCLLALPGADLASLHWVESHPVALAQCAGWLAARGLRARAVEDTAGAARAIASDRDFRRAAVASIEAAELYGLAVLARGIADAAENITRFVIVTRLGQELEAA